MYDEERQLLTNMYEEERRQLAAALGHDPDPDIWEFLVEEGYIGDLTVDPVGYLPRVVEMYERLSRLRGGGRRLGQQREVAPDRRSGALARILAAEASRRADVKAFRDRYLGGRLLTHEEAIAWIEGEAAQKGSSHIWTAVPIPPGALRRIPPTGDAAEHWSLLLAAAAEVPDEEKRTWGYPSLNSHVLRYVAPGEAYTRGVIVRFGSPLHALYRICERLERAYTWNQANAAIFVLTGIAPRLPLARIVTAKHGEWPALSSVTITARVSVPVRDIATVYSKARQDVLGEGRRDPAVTKSKTVELAVFAAEHNDGRTWREAMDAWNRLHPKWRYAEIRNFSRDARNAYAKITGRPLRWGAEGGADNGEPQA